MSSQLPQPIFSDSFDAENDGPIGDSTPIKTQARAKLSLVTTVVGATVAAVSGFVIFVAGQASGKGLVPVAGEPVKSSDVSNSQERQPTGSLTTKDLSSVAGSWSAQGVETFVPTEYSAPYDPGVVNLHDVVSAQQQDDGSVVLSAGLTGWTSYLDMGLPEPTKDKWSLVGFDISTVDEYSRDRTSPVTRVSCEIQQGTTQDSEGSLCKAQVDLKQGQSYKVETVIATGDAANNLPVRNGATMDLGL